MDYSIFVDHILGSCINTYLVNINEIQVGILD